MILSLRNQVLLLVMGVVLVTSISILIAFGVNTSRYTRQQVDRDIAAASEVFSKLLVIRERQLVSSAELLTADFGFKQAVATHDAATIDSVLRNHGARVDADLMYLADLDGRLVASTHVGHDAGAAFPPADLVARALRDGRAWAMIAVADRVFQTVVVPVRAPAPIALAGVGFELDRAVATELKTLTGLAVTFVFEDAPAVSTLPAEEVDDALAAGALLSPLVGVPLTAPPRYLSRRVDLGPSGDDVGHVVLTTRLDDSLAGFTRLRDGIVAITFAILGLAALLGFALSINLSRPLNQLSETARRVARGDYRREVSLRSNTREVSTLFEAFTTMRSDISEREARIMHQAQHDRLTDLFNRAALIERADAGIVRERKPAALICIRLSDLRQVNASFGPAVADDYVRGIAARLVESSPGGVINARSGTDEFIQLAPDISAATIRARCEALVEQLQSPLPIAEMRVKPLIVVGHAETPAHADTATKLVQCAAIAADNAIHERVAVRGFRVGDDDIHRFRLSLVNDLERAVSATDGQLFMYYQPKLDLRDGSVDQLEALIRWRHPRHGFVSPETFIPLAEQSSLINRLTEWVVDSVVERTARWHVDHPALRIAVNISARDLEREALLPFIRRALDAAELPARSLTFEMTEGDVMRDAERAIRLMAGFRDAGFDFAVDDYGVGHSSLSKLERMPVSELKIDRSFVAHLAQSSRSRTIVASTIDLAHALGLVVVAEGIESPEALTLLRAMGCDYAQGFHVSPPLQAEHVDVWIREFESSRRAVNH